MSKTKVATPMVICIKEDLPIIGLVKEAILKSAAIGSNIICFLPEKNFFTVFCSNGKRVTPIQILKLDREGKKVFFGMICRIKIMSGMNISDKKSCQTGCCVKTSHLQTAFTAITTPTEFGESIQIKLHL